VLLSLSGVNDSHTAIIVNCVISDGITVWDYPSEAINHFF